MTKLTEYNVLRRIGLNIKETRGRGRDKITQQKLAELTGLHRSHIASIEMGEINITIGTLFKISKALGKPLKDFFNEI